MVLTSQRRHATAAALLVLMLFSCGNDDSEQTSATSSSSSTTTAASPSTSTTATPSNEGAPATLTSTLPPPELPAGLVTTAEGLDPTVTFEVPAGWHGSQDSGGFGIGKGVDLEIQDFAEVGIFVRILEIPVGEAVSGFASLGDLEVISSTQTSVDDLPATTVEVSVEGEQAILEPIGVQGDIPHGDASVTFVDLDGRSVMISVQRWKSDAAKAEADGVVSTFQFS